MTPEGCESTVSPLSRQPCNALAERHGVQNHHGCIKGVWNCCVLQRSQSAGGKLPQGRHYEKCSRRFEVQGRADGRHSPVPDFKQLHTAWHNKLADCKAVNRSKATKPEVPLITCLPLKIAHNFGAMPNFTPPSVGSLRQCCWPLTVGAVNHSCIKTRVFNRLHTLEPKVS